MPSLRSLRALGSRLRVLEDRAAQPTPTQRIADFTEAFVALHQRVDDAAADDGGIPPIPDGIELPTKFWSPAKLSRAQHGYLFSTAECNVVDAGRRSFKSRGLLLRTASGSIRSLLSDGRFFLCAPTQQQAKDIFWEDVKRLIPTWALRGESRWEAFSESELTIHLWQGAQLRVAGLDKPARIEGGCWDGGGITEFGDCKPNVLDEHIIPMMVRPGAWIDIEGTPDRSKAHYFALATKVRDGGMPGARAWHWSTEHVLHLWLGREAAAKKLAQWAATTDPRSYAQEIRGEWVAPEARAYYTYRRDLHGMTPLAYEPNSPLVLCFDFNRIPGVAVACQEQQNTGGRYGADVDTPFTACLREVFLAHDSDTRRVCLELIKQWGGLHTGDVYLYGDATGGAKRSDSLAGSAWDIVLQLFRQVSQWRVRPMYPRSNPPVASRIGAVNSRLYSVTGRVRMMVDPKGCPHLLEDLDQMGVDDEGDLVKEPGSMLSHLSDAVGGYVAERWPLAGIVSRFE